jgi:polygalacturonase
VKRIGTLLFTLSALGGLSGLSAPLSGATVYHSDGSAAKVKALHNAALDGDTITLPAGTFTWSTPLPLFAGAEYLKSGIRCRLEQDLDAFELIIFDDPTSGRSGSVINKSDLCIPDRRRSIQR